MTKRIKISSVEVLDDGDTFSVEMQYPRNNPIKFVEVDMCDVRAADSVRVSYDFDRDGWKIEQAQIFEWETNDPVCDPGWIEVAFIQAWGRRKHG